MLIKKYQRSQNDKHRPSPNKGTTEPYREENRR